MAHPPAQTSARVSSNTAGLSAAQFLAAARRLAEERGALQELRLGDGGRRKFIPRAILHELRDRLGFGPLLEINPFGAELWRLPRGYRFACGCEVFADFSNINACVGAGEVLPFEPENLAA